MRLGVELTFQVNERFDNLECIERVDELDAAAEVTAKSNAPRRKRRATMQMGVTQVRPKKRNWSLERACLPTAPALCVFRRGDFGTSRGTVLDRLCDLHARRKGYDGLRRNA